jgi:hypothetical protein
VTLAGFLAEVIGNLDRLSIGYMVGGSTASSVYGEPRTTRDVDIVVEVDATTLRSLFESFDPSTVYIDRPLTAEDVSPGQMFNLIDLVGGWKVDLVVRKDRPFSEVEFGRRRPVELFGQLVMMATAEDVLLAKLEWAATSGSDRQLDDARGMVRVQGDRLDLDHLRTWADRLGVRAPLDEILDQSL